MKKMKNQEQYKNLLKFGFSLVIWAAMIAVWFFFWMEFYADIIMRPFGYKGNWLVLAVYGILQFVFTSFYGGYHIGYYRREDVAYSGILALIFCNTVTYLQTCLIGRAIMSPWPLLGMTVLQAVVIYIWSLVANNLYARIFPPRKMLMVYSGGDLVASLMDKLQARSEKYAIHEVLDIAEGIDKVCAKILEYKSVILCDLPAIQCNHLLKLCFEKGVRAYVTPKISDILIRGAADINLFDTPLLLCRNIGLTFEQRLIKRAVDIVFSVFGFVIASPFMLLSAIAIKLCDGGPVFYKQKRLTLNGKEFDVYKFRSMVVDAEKKNGAQLATADDDRITPVGKIIRMIRFDELPQLWNILKGDMSVVGPRPERPELAARHLETMPEFQYRLKVKAGLTGYAQIVGRYNTSAYDKLKMDLMYIAEYSFIQDLKLMLMTVKILFVRESTQGVSASKKDVHMVGEQPPDLTE